MKAKTILKKLKACDITKVGDLSPEQAWIQSMEGDDLLWIAMMLEVDRKLVVLAACKCARLMLPYSKRPEDKITIETTEAWCIGKATLDEVRKTNLFHVKTNAASSAASAAITTFTASAANYVSYVVVYVAADSASANNDYYKILKQCADIVRSNIPWSVIRDAAKAKGLM